MVIIVVLMDDQVVVLYIPTSFMFVYGSELFHWRPDLFCDFSSLFEVNSIPNLLVNRRIENKLLLRRLLLHFFIPAVGL